MCVGGPLGDFAGRGGGGLVGAGRGEISREYLYQAVITRLQYFLFSPGWLFPACILLHISPFHESGAIVFDMFR